MTEAATTYGQAMYDLARDEGLAKDLLDQLKAQNKFTDYCIDLVETYMVHYRLKEKLAADVAETGIRITVGTGNGHDKTIANPSVTDLKNETLVMLQILDKLELRQPVLAGAKDDYL